ncbi:MAG: hypothetical protein BMS9Abin26_1974 [Gammaproteobacteria bacterium]|nr:MAG: hypothetical protein BMS9Abin26_1974 [Gammaproteobacteria bacterium]
MGSKLSYDKKVFLAQLFMVIIAFPFAVLGVVTIIMGIIPLADIEPTLEYRVTAIGFGLIFIALSLLVVYLIKKFIKKYSENTSAANNGV